MPVESYSIVRGCRIPLHPGWLHMLESVYESQNQPTQVKEIFRRRSGFGSRAYRTLKGQMKNKGLIGVERPAAPLILTDKGLEVLNADRWARNLDPHPPKRTTRKDNARYGIDSNHRG